MHYFFGDKQFQVFPDRDKADWQRLTTLVEIDPFKTIASQHCSTDLLFGHQVHGVTGLIIDKKDSVPRAFTHDADWIITNKPGVGIGILTADCVPILLYDAKNNAIGAVHAGWRGATDGVISTALEGMRAAFGSFPKDLVIFIGPHAQTCCYAVDQPFYTIVTTKKWGRHAWHHDGNNLFFDLYGACLEQLNLYGITPDQINRTMTCTVCTPTYCSYRRERDQAGRNISYIGLTMS